MWKPVRTRLFLTEEDAISFVRQFAASMRHKKKYKIDQHVAGRCRGPGLAGNVCYRVFVLKHAVRSVVQSPVVFGNGPRHGVGTQLRWKATNFTVNEVRFGYKPDRIILECQGDQVCRAIKVADVGGSANRQPNTTASTLNLPQ